VAHAVGFVSGRRGAGLGAALALACAVLVQTGIEGGGLRQGGRHPLLYLPSGKYLRVAALGFDGLLADGIYLWSIQYYGNFQIKDRYAYLEHIYTGVISELDPHYLDPYLIGSLIMNTEARDPEMALRLLDKGIAANPDKWILPYEAGFLCYNDLKDYPRAAAYFEKALRAPDVHPLVRRLYAEMHNRAGDKRTSLREWSEIYDTARDDYVRTVALKHVHDLKVDVDLLTLTEAVARFEEKEGRSPARLEEMVTRGITTEVPRDPEDRGYRYDPRSGRVAYGGSLVLGR
jgi:tetratricopeptide (TPR) repeat protein